MLTNNMLLQLEKQLLYERDQIRFKLSYLRRMLYDETEREDEDGNLERTSTVSRTQDLERQLREIDRALERMERGTYGLCEQCGTPIDPARLEFMPETPLCVTCKATQEQYLRVSTQAGETHFFISDRGKNDNQ